MMVVRNMMAVAVMVVVEGVLQGRESGRCGLQVTKVQEKGRESSL
jgi:hypothetical protein